MRILCVLLMALPVFAGDQPGNGYTMKDEPSGEYYDWKKTNKPERPWLLPYHQRVVMKLFLCSKKWRDTGVDKVFLTFEQALAWETHAQSILLATDDFAEAVDAFVAKCAPGFTGR